MTSLEAGAGHHRRWSGQQDPHRCRLRGASDNRLARQEGGLKVLRAEEVMAIAILQPAVLRPQPVSLGADEDPAGIREGPAELGGPTRIR